MNSSVIKFIRQTSAPMIRDRFIYYVCSAILSCYTILHFGYLSDNATYNVTLYANLFFYALILAAILTAIGYFFVLLANREPRPLRAYWQWVILPIKHWDETINIVLLTVAISVTLSIYTTLKAQIPSLVPFYADPWLAKIDYAIHFNHMPWEITHKLFSSPIAGATINFFYNVWFFIMWLFLVTFLCLVSRPQLRLQVLLTFCLVWIINGNLAATMLSSVGPCYYNQLYPELDTFNQLFLSLNKQNDWLLTNNNFFNIWALKTQDDLWQSYLTATNGLGDGISAMPSIHLSIATLIAFALSHCHKYLKWLGWLYVGIIEVGSVHLGWHYAVDGYLSIVLTCLLWFSVNKWIIKRTNHQSPLTALKTN